MDLLKKLVVINLFHLLRLHHFFTAWLFVRISLLFVLYKAPKTSLWLTLGFVLLTFFLFYADTMFIEDRLINVLHCMIYFNI